MVGVDHIPACLSGCWQMLPSRHRGRTLEGKSANWQPFNDKVGGRHAPMLFCTDSGRLLKPLDQGARSQREVEAYQRLRTTPLGPFLASFYGTQTVADQCYMEIDNATHGLQRPIATIDIKLGKKTWEDDAPPEKIARAQKKLEFLKDSSARDGFRVVGMSAGDLKLNHDNLLARKSVLTEEFGAWLLPAFFAVAPGYDELPEGPAGSCQPDDQGCTVDAAGARAVLEQLRCLLAAVEAGFGGVLRSSSVLVVREMRSGGKWVVRLIDLAHFVPCEGDARDSNLCDGLENLVETMSGWCNSL